jgi:hypothetical protein
MSRFIDILAAVGLIVLCAPLLVLGWLGLKLQGVHPLCVRGTGDPDSSAGFSRFNASGDDPFSRFLRNYSIDLLPAVFDVLAGTTRLRDAVRDPNWIFRARRRPFTKREQLALVLIIFIFIALAIIFALPFHARQIP